MKLYVLLLAMLAVFTLVRPSSARPTAGPGSRRKNGMHQGVKEPTEHDKNLIRMRVYKAVLAEMGEDADEEAVANEVQQRTEQRLKAAYPEFYQPKVTSKLHSQSEDIWENGTVVRYLAGTIAALLAMAMLYAAKEQLLGNETFDGRRIKRTPAAKKDQ